MRKWTVLGLLIIAFVVLWIFLPSYEYQPSMVSNATSSTNQTNQNASIFIKLEKPSFIPEIDNTTPERGEKK